MKWFIRSASIPARILRLVIGLAICGTAVSLMIHAGLGASPWDVLAQGVALATGWSFGISSIIISAVVLLLWIPLRQRPGLGTIANAAGVGLMADFILAVLPLPSNIWVSAGYLIAGILMLALGTTLYIGAGLGPGPRDGLMTGLLARTGRPVWLIRGTIEVAAVIIGALMGGTVGVGTIVFALAIGPLIHRFVILLGVRLHERAQVKATAQPIQE
ncbi:hypothetical protein [Paeniglutamicibacter cryotolerans]|uniref:Putative membrane protein YczE n=1 Tax=Paeniglutamicibacter cryotolerans TaxID=670079 RepID=A0A839QNQ2_9MICC|nr:putative membrane protein YczE [Paeniglutamicibacter cryotolerans]